MVSRTCWGAEAVKVANFSCARGPGVTLVGPLGLGVAYGFPGPSSCVPHSPSPSFLALCFIGRGCTWERQESIALLFFLFLPFLLLTPDVLPVLFNLVT